jgi:arginyl-tRNA synthetase
VQAQYETAFRLGIYHDLLVWESDLVRAKTLEYALEKAKESGAVHQETEGKNAGCLVAKLSENAEFANMESPDKVLVRSDGTATYTAKDLAFVLWKFGLTQARLDFAQFLKQPDGSTLFTSSRKGTRERFPPATAAINVIGVEQAYPQRVLSLLLESMGYLEESKNYVHLAYEHAWLPDKKFSGREGSWVGFSADEVLDEAESRALAEIRTRFPDMTDEEKAKIARAVGIGAVRFDMLKTTPEKKIIFKWEGALNFEGDSAPYIQYSHARACRILEKAGEVLFGDASLLTTKEEHELILLLSRFPSTIAHAALDSRPHEIATYLLEVSSQFARFYGACPVLKAEPKMMEARLKLVKATQIVLRNGLLLLGIEAPERM